MGGGSGGGGAVRPASSRAGRRARADGGLARRGSASAADDDRGRVRRMGSLQGLRRWLSGGWRERERGGERERAEERREGLGIGESLEVVPEAY